ncbi:polysaccharide biosynthesis/export family protein [Granulicella pectinivorans]|jgi:polysaccharide export outer membrane protein|nr:polysaccharide biosynthesis/export family protein [Granulicella pectinivorans]
MEKNAMAAARAILLAGMISCTFAAAWAQGGQSSSSGQGPGQGSSQGSGQGVMSAPNPYIQSAPMVSAGQATALPSTIQSSADQGTGGMSVFYPDIKTYTLGPEDLINVRLFESPDFTTTLRLSSDGTARLPLIGSVLLGGLTVETAQHTIEERLKSAGMYRDPHISLTLGEFDTTQSSVTLAGELHGPVSIRRLHTLGEVLAAAGGLPATASSIVSIIRPGVAEPILVDLGTNAKDLAKADVPVMAHDTIFIQRLGVVYAVGAFKTTGLVPMQPGRTTLLEVAALTGGPLYAAKYSDMRIIRTVGTERTEVKVDIDKVLHGKAPDPIMQAGDIVFLPSSTVKTAISSGGLNLLLTLANLAVIVATRN